MSEANRGNGRTTQQMKYAPKGAIFIWVNEVLSYPIRLARSLNRSDLKIYRPSILEHSAMCLRGLELSGIIVDHAVDLTKGQLRGLEYLMPMVRLKWGEER